MKIIITLVILAQSPTLNAQEHLIRVNLINIECRCDWIEWRGSTIGEITFYVEDDLPEFGKLTFFWSKVKPSFVHHFTPQKELVHIIIAMLFPLPMFKSLYVSMNAINILEAYIP